MPKRIFISYGTADAMHVAQWLVGRLGERGYDVWWDRHRLPDRVGLAWDAEIEEAIRSSDAVIALMSPHSVRERGECRNEINFACDRGRRVVPVLARRCDRPLRINSLQYVDLDNFESLGHDIREAQLSRIIDAIEMGPAEDAACAALAAHFPRFDFDWMFARHRHFVGRKWLLDQFDRWVREDSEPVLFLVGTPGIGKSAVLAEWVKTRMGIGGVHFCRHDRADLRNPEAMVASLAGQLLRHDLPGHREALQAYLSDPRSPKDAGSMMDRLVLDPLRKQPEGSRWVLAIDALDEGGEQIYDLLARIKPFLATARMRLLLTSRPEADILQLFENKIVLRATDSQNRADITEFVEARISQISAFDGLTVAGRAALRDRLVSQCDGTFLVAQVTLDELEAGRLGLESVSQLSGGLASTYAALFARRFPTRESFTAVRRPLEVIMGAFEPITDDLIAQALGMKPRAVSEVLEPIGTFVPKAGSTGVRVPFHKSLFDWLDAQEPGTRFAASRDAGREALSETMRSGLRDSSYGLKWAFRHLTDAGCRETALQWMKDLAWLDRRAASGFAPAIAEDLRFCVLEPEPGRSPDPLLRELFLITLARQPQWSAGEASPSVDAANLSRPGSALHKLAIHSAPRPFLEVLSRRAQLNDFGFRSIPHPGMEYAIPLSPRASAEAASNQPRVISLSRDRFMIWDSDVRLELDGELQVFRGLNDAVLSALRESGPDGQTYEFVSPEPLLPIASDADAGRWLYSYAEKHFYAVRIGSRQISCLKLACNGDVTAVRHAADMFEALSAVGVSVPGFETLHRWARPASVRECVSNEPNHGEWVEPLFGALPCLLPAAASDAHGPRVGLRARYLAPGHRSNVPGMLAVPVAKLREKTKYSDQNWFAALGSARADRARLRGCVFVSPHGRFLAWPDASGAWFALDRLTFDQREVEQAERAGTGVRVSSRMDVLGLAWSPCEEWMLLTLSDGTVQLLESRQIFGLGGRMQFVPRSRVGAMPVARWDWLLPSILDGCDPPDEYLRLVRNNLAGVFKFEGDVKEKQDSQRAFWRRRRGGVKTKGAGEDDATKILASRLRDLRDAWAITDMVKLFLDPEILRDALSERHVGEDLKDFTRRVVDFCGDAHCVRCAQTLVGAHEMSERMDEIREPSAEVRKRMDEIRELAAEVRSCLTRVANRSATIHELLVTSGRLYCAWNRQINDSWKADRWWNDAVDAFVEKRSDADDPGQNSPTREEALAVVETLLALLSSPDASARSASAITTALGHAYQLVEFASPPLGSADPGAEAGELPMPRCVRVRWQSGTRFEALAPASAKGAIWVGELREAPDGLGQRFSVCKGRRPATGPRSIGTLADAGFGRPSASADWSPDGVRIWGHLVEIRSGEEAIARYTHSKSLRGYTINPHDRSLLALIDESWELIILRLHS